MRCPKCHYISFGSTMRCRNCGYEFSLSQEPKPVDLPIQDATAPIGPMGDLQLSDRPGAPSPLGARGADAAPPLTRLDLPLFSDKSPVDDAPLISSAGAPRPPLSVRRTPPAIPKPRVEKVVPARHVQEALAPAIEPDDDAAAVEEEALERQRELRRLSQALKAARDARDTPAEEPVIVAPIGRRFAAGVIDVLILASIDGAILYATLQAVGLTFADVRQLPPIPLAIFLLLLDGGYLAAFTAAGGQTIGKMAAGVRVVSAPPMADGETTRIVGPVPLGAAVLRAAAYLASLLPAGLGFAAILLDRDGRALHDRLSDTRVVRA
jgi:uncharacterized RDD family membrane protein YckC